MVSIASDVSALKVTMASRRLRNFRLKTRSMALFRLTCPVRPYIVEARPPPPGKTTEEALISRGRRSTSGWHGVASWPCGCVVGQRRVIHHPQQDVVDVGMRLRSRRAAPRCGMRANGTTSIHPARSRHTRAVRRSDATACSPYSLMSKRMNSLLRRIASCFASSVLPTPVGP